MNLNRAFGPLYKELTITSLRKPILWLIDETQLCLNKGPHPTRKDTAVISLSAIGQETRTRALLECERRFCTNRTEELNGSAVVKSSHELLCIGLDLRLCSCTHLKKQEALLVQDAVCDGFVKYGMKVFEYEHTEKQRIRQEQADEVTVGQAEGGSRKKSRTHTADPMMTFGQISPWETEDDYGFGDNEVQDVGCPVESVEDILEEVRVARAAELRKEAAVAFSEYRSYSRIQLTAQRGWDQYLPEKAAPPPG